MKCSLGISNFLEEISSLSHSVLFLYFFALIAEEGFLISSCYSLSEWMPGVGDGQGGLACCYSWGRRESDMTERLN